MLASTYIPVTNSSVRCANVNAVYCTVVIQSRQVLALMRSEINKGGLPMLYEIILDIAGPELKCALEVSFPLWVPVSVLPWSTTTCPH